MLSGKVIFIAPLDWGLGHTTRSVPLIRSLSEDNEVILGVTFRNIFFMEQQFPGLQKVMLPSYNIRYSSWLPVWLKILLQWPAINAVIIKERRQLKKLAREHQLELVISDNRFGLSSKKIKSIFITHQLQIKAPFLRAFANRLNRRYIHRFSEVWVPDYPDAAQRLSGELSNQAGIKIPVHFIGPLSYLSQYAETVKNSEKAADYLILLSGAEPQRSILESRLLEEFSSMGANVILVRGSADAPPIHSEGVQVIDFAAGRALCQLIVNAETVICRSGYSTLMDMHALGKKKLILIPTPGQTEQEYLAEHWQREFQSTVVLQSNMNEILGDGIQQRVIPKTH